MPPVCSPEDIAGISVPTVVRLLDENTANRIAAGEVIERPSSVVKELVENAIDAGATRIEIELAEGGKRRIVVRDNGCGMGREDAVLALQRHATSKISSADDLFSIRTLGFRGEALPSIASVSDFEMVTKRRGDDVATSVICHGGDIESVRDTGAPDGTSITVESLFFNTPARLKFLKTTQTELNHTVDLVHRTMLSHHRIACRLTNDGYEMISFPGADEPLHAVAAVWGRDAARAMVPIAYESPAISVRGFVSKPSLSKANRSAQATFVNGRFVRSRTVLHAFDSAFSSLMSTDRHPVLALFIDISPELVDVNVHPAKTEVRFMRDGDIYGAVRKAVENALLTGGLVPEVNVQASTPATVYATPHPRLEMDSFAVAVVLPGDERMSTPPRTALSSWGRTEVDLPRFADRIREIAETGTHEAVAPVAPISPFVDDYAIAQGGDAYRGFDGYKIGRLRVLAQSRNTYIVAETDDALLMIDQHIAHERVLYEQMMNGATGKSENWGVVAQHLALPQTLELDPREARVAEARIDALSRAGFIVEPFGGGTFFVRAVPAALANRDYLGVLREIVDEMTNATLQRRLLVPHEAAVIMASCKMAVKKGDPLTLDEMTRLLADLARMRNPFTCPHGRPILLALPHREMDRKFHRIGPH